MALGEDDRREIELELADGFLQVHLPRAQYGAAATGDPVAGREVCRYCLVAHPCPRARWATEKKNQWRQARADRPAASRAEAPVSDHD